MTLCRVSTQFAGIALPSADFCGMWWRRPSCRGNSAAVDVLVQRPDRHLDQAADPDHRGRPGPFAHESIRERPADTQDPGGIWQIDYGGGEPAVGSDFVHG